MSAPDRIDAELLAELQDLAAISLSSEESEALREKLQRVVEFLAEIDAVEIPEPEGWDPAPRLRPDESRPSLDHEEVMDNAPRREGRFFVVKPVLGAGAAESEDDPS